MSAASKRQIDQWTVDFGQAKNALGNLDILVRELAHGQAAVVNQLRVLFETYAGYAGEDTREGQKARDQAALLDKVEINIRETTAKFLGQIQAQLKVAREQVSVMAKNAGKLRSLKGPQYTDAVDHLMQRVPEFLTVFDAFLARITLEIRLRQADFYKQFGTAFTHAGRAEPTSSIAQTWFTEFEQIMPAVESLKIVHPPDDHHRPDERFETERIDPAILAPVKWLSGKISKEIKEVHFSDPRKGFFNKPTTPPAHHAETLVAIYDFTGEADSDLTFNRGDIITVVDKGTEDDPNWWCGEFNGQRGLFPKNYVEEQQPSVSPTEQVDEYVPAVSETGDGAGAAAASVGAAVSATRRSSDERHASDLRRSDSRRSADARRSFDSRRSGDLRRSSSFRRSGEGRRMSGEARRSGEVRRSMDSERGTRRPHDRPRRDSTEAAADKSHIETPASPPRLPARPRNHTETEVGAEPTEPTGPGVERATGPDTEPDTGPVTERAEAGVGEEGAHPAEHLASKESPLESGSEHAPKLPPRHHMDVAAEPHEDPRAKPPVEAEAGASEAPAETSGTAKDVGPAAPQEASAEKKTSAGTSEASANDAANDDVVDDGVATEERGDEAATQTGSAAVDELEESEPAATVPEKREPAAAEPEGSELANAEIETPETEASKVESAKIETPEPEVQIDSEDDDDLAIPESLREDEAESAKFAKSPAESEAKTEANAEATGVSDTDAADAGAADAVKEKDGSTANPSSESTNDDELL